MAHAKRNDSPAVLVPAQDGADVRHLCDDRHSIVIVGGGAGGLELAARLGDRLRPSSRVEVTLVDPSLTHVWKPLLHELAAGTLRLPESEVDYLHLARRHRFHFHLGALEHMDRARRQIWLAPLVDDLGEEIAPRRALPYDTAVIAVGSVVNDFGTPGVREHALALDEAEDARQFHRRMLAACARAELSPGGQPVDIVIVGGGATGVELAAELQQSMSEIAGYGTRLSTLPQAVRLTLIEAGPRLLAALSDDIARTVQADLLQMGVEVRLGSAVTGVHRHQVTLADGDALHADLTVWAAGIQGPRVLRSLDGLELARSGQLVVHPTLQSSRDPNVFAMGDCASCMTEGGQAVPPRAQAAQQQALFLADALLRHVQGRPLPSFAFRERGALVSLGSHDAVGRVGDPARGRSLRLRGLVANLAYWSLQRRHMVTLHGLLRTVLTTLAGWLAGRTQPRVKLH